MIYSYAELEVKYSQESAVIGKGNGAWLCMSRAQDLITNSVNSHC